MYLGNRGRLANEKGTRELKALSRDQGKCFPLKVSQVFCMLAGVKF